MFFVFRKKIDDLEEELTQGQETEKNLQTNLNHIQDNQLLSRNQHRARLDKRLDLFRELKVIVLNSFLLHVSVR